MNICGLDFRTKDLVLEAAAVEAVGTMGWNYPDTCTGFEAQARNPEMMVLRGWEESIALVVLVN